MTSKTDQELFAEAMVKFGKIMAVVKDIKTIDDVKKIVDSALSDEPLQEDTSVAQAVNAESIKDIQYRVQCMRGRHEQFSDLLSELETQREIQERDFEELAEMLDKLLGEVD